MNPNIGRAAFRWGSFVTPTYRAELACKGIGYETLSKKLNELGVDESYNSINTKINRGAFTFQFFLQYMKTLGVKLKKAIDIR